ncbi:MAG: response regulator, partial [Pseudomonadota bacterium]|nr:response regulator [Pseudomonadota bacterium]
VSLVLLDRLMPGGGSAEAAAEARGRGIPVIIMSGDPTAIGSLNAAGMPFVAKPFSGVSLLAAADRALAAAPVV